MALELRRAAVTEYRAEYEEYARDFCALDSKAQGTIGIAGIFLAAVFAFVRQLLNTAPLGNLFVVLTLAACVILLLASVLLALRALLVHEVTSRPPAEDLSAIAEEFLNLGDPQEQRDRLSDFHGEAAEQWKDCVKGIAADNARKAGSVYGAQIVLVAAIALAALLTLSMIVSPYLSMLRTP